MTEPNVMVPIAWMWEYIGKDPLGDNIKPCARALHEMNPESPPYPNAWKPLYPLYAAPAVEQQAVLPACAYCDQEIKVGQYFKYLPSGTRVAHMDCNTPPPPSSPAEGTTCPTLQQLQIKLLRSHGLHSVADEYEYTLQELSAANRALVEAYERCAKLLEPTNHPLLAAAAKTIRDAAKGNS